MCQPDPHLAGAQIDQTTVDLVREVRRKLNIALAVKLSPFYSNLAALAHSLVEAGADGLVLFNRFN